MASLLRDRAASSAAMLAVFGDESLLTAALTFESALARAEGAEGLIPRAAAHTIERVCADATIDIPTMAEAAAHAGTLAIPLVAELRSRVAAADGEAAAFVHRGASSQDLADTALMLQAKDGAALIEQEAAALCAGLADLAERHTATPMLARTLLQGAAPITFGVRAATWLAGVDGALTRFEREAAVAIRLQLGGAAGSRAGLSAAVVERLAAELDLAPSPLPWHARREALAGLASALAILIGAIAKIARDVSLMAQNEVGEAFEPRIEGRGGSSSMPHKRNATGCQVALAAAARGPGLAAGVIAGLAQEQERGLGSWQAEAPALAGLFELAHGALCAMRPVIEGLEVDPAAMARHLAAAHVGDDAGLSEVLVAQALSDYRGRRRGGR